MIAGLNTILVCQEPSVKAAILVRLMPESKSEDAGKVNNFEIQIQISSQTKAKKNDHPFVMNFHKNISENTPSSHQW